MLKKVLSAHLEKMSHSKFMILENPQMLPSALQGAAIAIGNFDGVHKGHQKTLESLKDYAQSHNCPALVCTFDPNPKKVFWKDRQHFCLTTLSQKINILEDLKLDGVIVLKFDEVFAAQSAQQFTDYLFKSLKAHTIFVGENFFFGKNKSGNATFLQEQAKLQNKHVEIISLAKQNQAPISSTRIREALKLGDMATANLQLGRPFAISGTVEHGEKRGRELGYPTANIPLSEDVMLKHGIYAANCIVEGQKYSSIVSFGKKPTFGEFPLQLEAHIFDFSNDIYGKTIKVEFLHFLRPELKFNSVESLLEKMHQDVEQAKEYFTQ